MQRVSFYVYRLKRSVLFSLGSQVASSCTKYTELLALRKTGSIEVLNERQSCEVISK